MIMESYKDYILRKMELNGLKARGEFSRFAEFLGVNTSFVSQVLKSDKHFSLEQIAKCSKYLSLTELEEDYLIHLNQYERAGTNELRNYFEKKLNKIREKNSKVSEVLKTHKSLSFEDQSVFYSNWYYSAIRLATDIEGNETISKLASFLKLNSSLVADAIHFLLEKNLLKKEHGQLVMTDKMTHLKDDSPFIFNHHKNWRIKAMENFSHFDKQSDLAFSAPLTISEKDFQIVREDILAMIKKLGAKVADSKSEELVCFNIDFFKIKN